MLDSSDNDDNKMLKSSGERNMEIQSLHQASKIGEIQGFG
jgi:hypothetical protein